MKKFIFGDRGGIYIIDLEKTAECLATARDFARNAAAKGSKFLLVGTKKQAQEVVRDEAVRCGMSYINSRWMGGLLTNFETVKKSLRKLQDIERMEKDGTFTRLTKKEVSLLNKEKDRLVKALGGIREMNGSPDVMLVIDINKEEIAIKEAIRLGIPVIAMVDTNTNPEPVAYPVPANDDAVKSIRLITAFIVDGVIEGRKEYLSARKPVELVETSAVAPQETKAEVSVVDESLIANVVDESLIATVVDDSLAEKLGVKVEAVAVEKIKDLKKPTKKGSERE